MTRCEEKKEYLYIMPDFRTLSDSLFSMNSVLLNQRILEIGSTNTRCMKTKLKNIIMRGMRELSEA